MTRQFGSNEKGSVLVISALLLPVLLGLAAFLVDLSNLYVNKAAIQRAADAAALGGVLALPDGRAAEDEALNLVSKNTPGNYGTLSSTKDVKSGVWDPNEKKFTPSQSNPNAIKVLTRRTVENGNALHTFFGRFVGVSELELEAESIAVQFGGKPCVMLLDPSASASLDLGGSAQINLNCALQINSSSSTAAYRTGSSKIRTQSACIAGGYNTASGWSPVPKTGCPVRTDPLAFLPEPSAPLQTCSAPDWSGTMPANCTYTGWISLSGTINLQPGLYYFKSGHLSLASGAMIKGSGVTIFLDAQSTLDLGGNGSANLSASTSGQYEGVLVFQSRSTPKTSTPVSLGGSGDLQVNGAIYVPTATLALKGNSSYETKVGYVIANKMQIGGSSSFGLNAFGAEGINPDAVNTNVTAGLVQ